jgi:Xaa-Pro aminopeptidase
VRVITVINMEPVLKRGYTAWDQALLPADEFNERVSYVRAAMRSAGLDALLVWGNQYEYADFTYLAGMPTAGTLLLTHEGEPAIFTGGGGRELPFQRTLTWVGQLSAAGPMPGATLNAALAERSIDIGTVGLVGTHLLSAATHTNVTNNLNAYTLRKFDGEFSMLRARKRPREVTTVRTALRIATDAVAAAITAFNHGATTTEAMVEAERTARVNKARDIRILANVDSDDLRPFEGRSPARRAPLLLWIGVDYHGYWADVAASSAPSSGSRAEKAVEAMTAAANPGAHAADIARAGLARLSSAAARESAQDYGLGSGIGLALSDWPTISPTSDAQLVDGGLLSLRALARDGDGVSFANAIVQVATGGGQKLSP